MFGQTATQIICDPRVDLIRPWLGFKAVNVIKVGHHQEPASARDALRRAAFAFTFLGTPKDCRTIPRITMVGLPAEARNAKAGASCRARTDDRRFTKPLLYH